jgi:hypothetical protein
MTIPASDCATHNGPVKNSGAIQKFIDAQPPNVRAGLQAYQRAIRQRKDWHRAVVAAIEACSPLGAALDALRTARALLASLRDNDIASYSFANNPMTMAERAAIAEYDVVLAQIDEVLNG